MTTDSSINTFEIDYRIGQGNVQSENWGLSSDNEGLFYPDNTLNFIHQLESSNVFVAQVIPVGQDDITSTFDTTGLSVAVMPILKACGFSS